MCRHVHSFLWYFFFSLSSWVSRLSSTAHVYTLPLCACPPWFSVVAVRRTVSKPPPPEQDCDWRQLLKCLDCFSSQCKSLYGSSLHVHTQRHMPSTNVTVRPIVRENWRMQYQWRACCLRRASHKLCLGALAPLPCSTSTLVRFAPRFSFLFLSSMALHNSVHLVLELCSKHIWNAGLALLAFTLKSLKGLTHGAVIINFSGILTKAHDANKSITCSILVKIKYFVTLCHCNTWNDIDHG